MCREITAVSLLLTSLLFSAAVAFVWEAHADRVLPQNRWDNQFIVSSRCEKPICCYTYIATRYKPVLQEYVNKCKFPLNIIFLMKRQPRRAFKLKKTL